jgi:hypothetical protein
MTKSMLTVLLCSLFLLNACAKKEQNETSQNSSKTMKKETAEKPLRHVVLFKFNEKATDSVVKKIETAFADLPNKISEIHSFEWGTNNSEEKLDKGLTHCFLLTFRSTEDRDVYLPHPAHQAFVQLVGDYVEDVTVVDYWAK